MGYAYKHRESLVGSATTKVVSYPSCKGTTLSQTIAHVQLAGFLLEDVSYLLTQVGINNTVDTDNFKITLTDDNTSFYVGVYTSSNLMYPMIFQDGDPGADSPAGVRSNSGTSALITSGYARYNVYIFTTDEGNFYLEITDNSYNRHYPLFCYCKVDHPTNPNKQALVVSSCFPPTQSLTGMGTKTKDIEDLTHDVMVTVSGNNTTVIPALLATQSKIGIIFPDLSENNSVIIKNLVWYDLLEIPGFYQVSTSVDHWTNFDDGTYKYHVLAYTSSDSNSGIRVAIRYGTVA